MKDFTTLVTERRSANKFIPGIEIANEELDEIFNLVKYGPSAFNLQHTHYIVVKDHELIDEIYEVANKQYKLKTASAVIIVLGSMDAHLDAPRIYEGMLHLGIMNKQEYEFEVTNVQAFYEGRGETFKRDEAIRNASLSGMLFMLAAKDKGWDTCPMIGFDPDAVAQILNVNERYVPAMMISIGKEDHTKRRLRGYRKPIGEFVTHGKFNK